MENVTLVSHEDNKITLSVTGLEDGVVKKLADMTFEANEGLAVGNYNIFTSIGDANIGCDFQTIVLIIKCDINGDGKVNNKDLTRLFQYLSGWDVEVNIDALDINGDGKVNNKDITRLFQYLPGWEVEVY